MLSIIDQKPKTRLVFSAPSKVGGSKPIAFGLPAGPDFSCPGATEACGGCYAQKGRFAMGNVQEAYANNWVIVNNYLDNKDYRGLQSALLGGVKESFKEFRIHHSGDFFSNEYVSVWAEVIQARPNTMFWLYTRSFQLDFSPIMKNKNVLVWASSDDYNANEALAFAKKWNIRLAHGPIESLADLPAGAIACPVTSKKLANDGACIKCRLCIEPGRFKKNIAFIKH